MRSMTATVAVATGPAFTFRYAETDELLAAAGLTVVPFDPLNDTGLPGDVVDTLVDAPALREYHLLPSVRGDLLAKLGRHAEARTEFERAASLATNAREAGLLRRRAADTTVD